MNRGSGPAENHREQWQVATPQRQTKQEDNSKMRQFDSSNYRGIPAYLMDFGFGGFLGYGKTMPVGVALDEELKRCVMSEGRCKM